MNHSLTLERMRADIARLLHESPDDILDADNLMDLGLDSMRLMKLASQWREAGARVEFADLAVEATLGHWWALVSDAARNDTAPNGASRA